jgi:D-glycero-D-manno-heptose 1,7-bisphosphate phosphatase
MTDFEKRPAVFLDRDGTIIKQVEELTDTAQLELIPGAADAIADLNWRGFFVIVITNQPNIEKGLLTQEGLAAIHKALEDKLAASGARLDAIYTCPHAYRAHGQCECRKPGLKLIQDAQSEFPIDMEHSWFIGDRLRDIETGKRAKLKTILVQTGGEDKKDDEFFPDAKPDHVAQDLAAAVHIVQ